MVKDRNNILIIPCSGIGKAFGTISRETTYIITEDLRPNCTDVICLSSLTMRDNESISRIQKNPVITIDGCPKLCAKNNVEKNNGKLLSSFTVFDAFRDNKDLKTTKISSIDENGHKLALILAESIVRTIDVTINTQGKQ